MVKIETLGFPHVVLVWLVLSKGMLLVKYFTYDTFLVTFVFYPFYRIATCLIGIVGAK